MKEVRYAPVIIPTLNRYEHLKRCLESLEHCKDAEFTDVYVGLDYPPSDNYVEGWKRIDTYLKEKEVSNGFSHLFVKRRDKNLGAVQNYTELKKEVIDYGVFIFTEDDNEFSPCFLSYMNQNLALFKDDNSVFRICGYLPFKYNFKTEYTQFKAQRHIAWGVGEWVDKYKDFNEIIRTNRLLKIVSDKRVQNYFEDNKMESMLFSIVKMSKSNNILEDYIVAAYLVYKNMRCILPTQSMVRNHGLDGSGLNCGYSSDYIKQEIQVKRDYYMNEAPMEFTESFERDLHDSRRRKRRGLKSMQDVFKWYIYKYFGVFIS